MADRSDQGRDDVSSTRGGQPRRGAEGGSEAHGASGSESASARPSSQSVSEGLEGSILDDATGNQQQGRTGEGDSGGGRSTGIGSEASEGIHAAHGGRDQAQPSSVESAGTGMSGSGGDVERAGSEPLHARTQEHQSGYGGFADRPKTSSDQRESLGDEEAGDGL